MGMGGSGGEQERRAEKRNAGETQLDLRGI